MISGFWKKKKSERIEADFFFCPIQCTKNLVLEDRRARAIFGGSETCLNWMAVKVFNTSFDDNHPSQQKAIIGSALN